AGPVFWVFGEGGKAAFAQFVAANQEYQHGEYQKAAESYGRLIRDGFNSAALFYNLGNANLKMGNIGRAVLNYERAKVLTPRDADVDYNLALTREKVADQADRPQSELLGWLGSLSASEAYTAFAVVNALFFLLLAVRVWKKNEALYYLAAALFTLWLTAGLVAGAKYVSLANDDRAVVLSEKVSVRAGPSEKETLLFNLHAGSLVSLTRTEGGYSLVSFSDKKRGWVKAEDVRSILPLPPAQPL
ncbi:MAG: hypothetical protein AB1921_17710, partial [Thermodesulfobacteriota bacterium]